MLLWASVHVTKNSTRTVVFRCVFSSSQGQGQNNQWKPNLFSVLGKGPAEKAKGYISLVFVNAALFWDYVLWWTSLFVWPLMVLLLFVQLYYTCTTTQIFYDCPKIYDLDIMSILPIQFLHFGKYKFSWVNSLFSLPSNRARFWKILASAVRLALSGTCKVERP